MGTVIVVGVIVLVLVVFVGLVWLFVRLSRPVAAATPATRPGRPAATRTATPPPAREGDTPRQKKRTRKGKARKRR